MEYLTPAAHARVLDILHNGRDMTLATIRPDGFPQATTVSYTHDDLIIYAAIGLGSQKADNIQHNNKVSATINLDYADWNHIRGISLAGIASFVQGAEDISHVSEALLARFPRAADYAPAGGALPWPGILFLCIVPTVISLLDYGVGFGHTEIYAIDPRAVQAGSA
jgi:general stress protein 26